MSLTTNLVSYWKMDEGSDTDRADSHGSNTLTSHGVAVDTGILGNAGAFQAGAGDYLSLATNASVEFTTAFSIQVWAYSDTSFAPSATFASKWLYASAGGWTFSMDGVGSQLRMWVADSPTDSGGNVIDSTGASFGVNTWYHIVAVYDGSQATASDRVKFYINGSPTGTNVLAGTIPSSLQNNSVDFNISYWPGLNRHWDGRLDEIAIWSRALSGSEVTQLYNGGNALAYPFGNSFTLTAPRSVAIVSSETRTLPVSEDSRVH